MKTKAALFIALTVFVICDSAYVDTLKKCGHADGNCQKELYQSVINEISGTGIPELGIPAIDPIELKDIGVSILGMVNLTFVDGVVTGIKECTFNSFDTNIEKGYTNTDITCDLLTVKGQYKLEEGPVLQNLLGEDAISGDGNGKVDLEKVVLKFKIPFTIEKRDDGEIYVKCKFEEPEYTYDVLGKITVDADNIRLGSQEVSKIVVKFLNEKWKHIMTSFGKFFADKAVEIYYLYLGKFFEGVPAKIFFIEDLTPFVKS